MVRHLFGRLLAVFLLVVTMPTSAYALVGIFYQPQERDMRLPESFWPQTFAHVRQLGFDTVIFQWSRYGDIFSEGRQQQWLEQRAADAVAADLNVVMGLYADPDSFSAVEVGSDLLEPYFLKVMAHNLDLVKRWGKAPHQDRLIGWYLPFEVDDRRWRGVDDQRALAEHLGRETREIQAISDRPVFVSSFFNGNATPRQFSELIKRLGQTAGLHVWVQDGVGTGTLSPVATRRYLAELTRCDDLFAAGIVYELFEQTGPDSAFVANPLPAAALRRALKQRAPCEMQTTFFSLRYVVPFGD